MILWDIVSGERLRTFEGHDRGLACIEFKVCFFSKRVELYFLFYAFRTISLCLVLMTARLRFGVQRRGNAFEHWWDMMLLFEHCHSILVLDGLLARVTIRVSSCGTWERVSILIPTPNFILVGN